MKKFLKISFIFLSIMSFIYADITTYGGASRIYYKKDITEKIPDKKIKNVILFIGDGMGDSEITIARNYIKGAEGYFEGIDTLPFTGSYTTYSLDKKTHKPNYVTDSAASATAWSIGVKTYNGALGIDVYGKSHESLIELAKKAGIATGDITTAEIQDATPAALLAHINSRKCYAPSQTNELCKNYALKNNGLGSISEQIISTRPDIIMGGGSKSFNEKVDFGKYKGKTLKDQALLEGYQVINNTKELESLKIANQNNPVLGLFAKENLPTKWIGPQAIYEGNLNKKPVKCKINPEYNLSTPSLVQMTKKSIELLSQNKKGFFLQVESASIDKQDHIANACGQIGEVLELDEALQVALDFAKENGETLVILTADHGHSSQIIENDARAPGFTQSLITKDGSIMTISYGNSQTLPQGHTGTQVRIAAFGPYGENILGLLDQTDLFFIIAKALKIQPKN